MKELILSQDRYDGVIIEKSALELDGSAFESALQVTLKLLSDKKLMWITLGIERADLIALLAQNGFEFHHCGAKVLTMVKRLIEDAFIPTSANHTLGVGAVVLNDGDLLVIKDRIYQTYKLPGGFIDDDEQISQAVIREVLEETGVKVAFESVVSLGHFTPAQFGESNLYVVVLAKPLSRDIEIRDTKEIIEACWMDVHEYLKREDVLPYNKAIVHNALAASKGLRINNDIALHVKQNTQYELFF